MEEETTTFDVIFRELSVSGGGVVLLGGVEAGWVRDEALGSILVEQGLASWLDCSAMKGTNWTRCCENRLVVGWGGI